VKFDKYRHEQKYLISSGQLRLIKSRIECLMKKDSNVGEKGYYNIRSLYFDDYYDRCYYENENGTDPREKFRIRIYNHSSERISLECKRKEHGKTLKNSCKLTKEQCEKLINNEYIRDIANQPEVLKKLTMEMMSRKLHPKVIVEYDRIPYVYRYGNVRVTLDINVSSSSFTENFLSGNIPKRPIMQQGLHLLEVKWDEYLPDTIYTALQLENLQQTAYSKYYLCRKYSQK
jgi:hypothetical protein